VAVEFLTDEQAARYAAFDGAPSRAELERFFFLDDADRELVEGRRRAHNRLGFAVQLTSVRFLGRFLPDLGGCRRRSPSICPSSWGSTTRRV
jgi:TnpA family transposase